MPFVSALKEAPFASVKLARKPVKEFTVEEYVYTIIRAARD